MNFFSWHFPLHEFFFLVPPSITFLMVRPPSLKDQREAEMWRQLIGYALVSIQVNALCFGELSDVFDCKKG